ncbi:conserved hypothetical protein [Gloeothece citriformis PCC 7424]|uniref:Uncharacterized protein n=1 Tax=Gloeothece citriformis (strain PCC 7424) TaxID=65393 RepID=B7K734_GLOC7|nr:hypothetical protein [Gloeothece citriformis]ACK69602.1 conserved hypothetical protein [Gloeothece citriformis PCC 7424]
MAGKIQKLKEDLTNLEKQTSLLYDEIYEAYQKYLEALSQSVKKQLILATYQICTQSYPQAFLNLSYNQRQKIQEDIKKLAQEFYGKIEPCLTQTQGLDSESLSQLNLMEKMLLNLSNSDFESEEEIEQDIDQDSETLAPIESTEENPQPINNPNQLINWCQIIEQEIVMALDNLSKEVNHILQQSQILPNQLPPQVLDMAIQAEDTGQSVSGSPNLLNVIVETGQKNLDDNLEDLELPSKITKITAIHLRLVEIELADANLSISHKEIRNLLEKVAQLRKQYHKKQKECAIAEAESAWRACWYEDKG